MLIMSFYLIYFIHCVNYSSLQLSRVFWPPVIRRSDCQDSYHRQVDVGRVHLQVDLPVDGSLAVLVEILSHLRVHVAVNTHTHRTLLFKRNAPIITPAALTVHSNVMRSEWLCKNNSKRHHNPRLDNPFSPVINSESVSVLPSVWGTDAQSSRVNTKVGWNHQHPHIISYIPTKWKNKNTELMKWYRISWARPLHGFLGRYRQVEGRLGC